VNIVPILVGCSLFLVVCAVALFVWCVGRGDHEHGEQLALLPFDEDRVHRKESDPSDHWAGMQRPPSEADEAGSNTK
jgi:nitrogen fixation-related uncharacterized protein